jgi:hypothetical protein
MDTVKCNRCLVKLPVSKFETKRCGTLRKLCVDCNLKNKERFKCTECDAKFSSNSQWQRHINSIHLKLKSFKCSQCEYKCSQNSNLKVHINSVHLNLQPFKCSVCEYECSLNSKLKRHMDDVHLKIQPFKCNLCDFKCGVNCDLQKHINSVHLKIQPFQCSQCDLKFSQNGNLQTHINGVHLKLKPFACSQCDLKFSANGDLQTHINGIHLKLQPFKCENCEYKCSSNGNLQKHIKTCTGELKCSAGEFKIMKVLADLDMEKNENYLYNTSFWNVKDKNLLRWDFIVNHNENPVVIEFDGEQHFRPVRFGGSKEQSEQRHDDVKRRDKIKNDHCKENNIPILRISYLDLDNIETLVKEFLDKYSPHSRPCETSTTTTTSGTF